MSHLGDGLAALVDGALDHASRERALAHLAHCAPCRREVDDHRRLKALLGGLREQGPAPSGDLVSRLMAVPAGPTPLSAPPLSPPPGRRRPGLRRGSLRPRSVPRPPRRPGTLARRTATAGVLVVAGLAGALALGAPTTAGPRAPVDPASPALLVDHISTTSEVPLTEPAFATTVVPVGSPAR